VDGKSVLGFDSASQTLVELPLSNSKQQEVEETEKQDEEEAEEEEIFPHHVKEDDKQDVEEVEENQESETPNQRGKDEEEPKDEELADQTEKPGSPSPTSQNHSPVLSNAEVAGLEEVVHDFFLTPVAKEKDSPPHKRQKKN